MSRGVEKCTNVYPRLDWEKISAQRLRLPLGRSRAGRLERFTFASAFFVELDGQGRVAIPLPLRQYAEIREVAVVAGVNKLVEIWSKENWEAERDLMAGEARRISEAEE